MADPSLPYLGAGFGVAWILLAAYLVRLARAQRDISRRLDRMERSGSLDAGREEETVDPSDRS